MAEILLSKKRRQKLKRRRVVRTVWGCALIIFVITTFSIISHQSVAQISKISIQGNQLVESDNIAAIINTTATKPLWWIFSRDNFLLFPTATTQKDLLAGITRLATASVRRSGLRSLSVTVSERQPTALWCASRVAGVPEYEDGKCYLLDRAGFIFAPAPTYSGPVFIRFVEYQNATTTEISSIGRQFKDPSRFQDLFSFADNLSSLPFSAGKPSVVFMREDGDLDVIFDGGLKISVSGTEPFGDTRHTLGLLLSNSDFTTLIRNTKKRLEYLDVRFEGKVFYKFVDVAR